jgi:hypothetical protein
VLTLINPALANAGYLINDLFGNKKTQNYLNKPSTHTIEVFTI